MIHLEKGDITKAKTEAIVNAANNALRGGGGVDGAIHRAAGPGLLKECQQWVAENGELPTGQAMFTGAGELSQKFVIHTVGPVWQGGTENEDQLLANCYINSLHICGREKIPSVAFPNISTGVYGYPKRDAAEVAVATVRNFFSSYEKTLEVTFVCFDEGNFGIYEGMIKER